MSDTVVVMDKGEIQQIGSPIDIYNEPKNAFVADFIGESNILDGTMIEDYLVEVAGQRFKSLDSASAKWPRSTSSSAGGYRHRARSARRRTHQRRRHQRHV